MKLIKLYFYSLIEGGGGGGGGGGVGRPHFIDYDRQTFTCALIKISIWNFIYSYFFLSSKGLIIILLNGGEIQMYP